jgi:pSer/pThr/pTyr-binding forkhead associated (FHA) protein
MVKRKGAKAFSTGQTGSAGKTTNFSLDPTRVDAVQAGLEEVDEHGEQLFHTIVTDTFSIGRDPDSNLVIKADTKTSRRHATINRRGIAYILEDNNSSNGTFVNGEKIKEPRVLLVGDRVKIGNREFTFSRKAPEV